MSIGCLSGPGASVGPSLTLWAGVRCGRSVSCVCAVSRLWCGPCLGVKPMAAQSAAVVARLREDPLDGGCVVAAVLAGVCAVGLTLVPRVVMLGCASLLFFCSFVCASCVGGSFENVD